MAAQTVTRQNAFWAIAVIALNSMAQDGGDVCSVPARYKHFLLASPYFCLIDALSIIYSLIRASWQEDRVEQPIQAFAKQRHWPSSETRHSSKQVSSGWFLQHIVLPAMALLQLVKIMGYRGLPWTQAFAMMYSIDWLTRLVLNHSVVSADCSLPNGNMRRSEHELEAAAGAASAESNDESILQRVPAGSPQFLFSHDKWLVLALTAQLLHLRKMLILWVESRPSAEDQRNNSLLEIICAVGSTSLPYLLAYFIDLAIHEVLCSNQRCFSAYIWFLTGKWRIVNERNHVHVHDIILFDWQQRSTLDIDMLWTPGIASFAGWQATMLLGAPMCVWMFDSDQFYELIKQFQGYFYLCALSTVALYVVGCTTLFQMPYFFYDMTQQIRRKEYNNRPSKDFSLPLMVISIFAQTIASVIWYYGWPYEDHGTLKPSWTENLP